MLSLLSAKKLPDYILGSGSKSVDPVTLEPLAHPLVKIASEEVKTHTKTTSGRPTAKHPRYITREDAEAACPLCGETITISSLGDNRRKVQVCVEPVSSPPREPIRRAPQANGSIHGSTRAMNREPQPSPSHLPAEPEVRGDLR